MSPALLALALSATTVSTSKLGVFVAGDIGSPTSPVPIIAACPALAVFPIDSSSDPNAATATVSARVATYRATCPGGKIVLQIGGTAFDLTIAGALYAIWPTWFVQLQTVGMVAPIDGVEGPLGFKGDAAQVAAFWPLFAQKVGTLYLPLIGAGAAFPTPDSFCPVVNSVKLAVGAARFGWTFHAFSPMTFSTTDPAFGFRQIRDTCGLAGVPLFMTQLGPACCGWDATATSWLAWFDQQIAQDADLRGAALFQLGASPDITAIAPFLVEYFRNPIPPDGGFPDGGDAGGSGGVVPQHETAGGTLSSSSSGCSTVGPACVAALLVPGLMLLRRRTRRQPRGPSGPTA